MIGSARRAIAVGIGHRPGHKSRHQYLPNSQRAQCAGRRARRRLFRGCLHGDRTIGRHHWTSRLAGYSWSAEGDNSKTWLRTSAVLQRHGPLDPGGVWMIRAQSATNGLPTKRPYLTACELAAGSSADCDENLITRRVRADLGVQVDRTPQSLTVCEGETATLTVEASGAGTLQFQWRHYHVPIPGGDEAVPTRSPRRQWTTRGPTR